MVEAKAYFWWMDTGKDLAGIMMLCASIHMQRRLIIYISVLTFKLVSSQETVILKGSFSDHCYAIDNHKYSVELILNDSISFKQLLDTTLFEFNVPKFLINKRGVTVMVRKLTFNELHGTICFPYIVRCFGTIDPIYIPFDSLFYRGQYVIKLSGSGQGEACGTLPTIQFSYNSSNVDSAKFYFINETASIENSQWDSYCIAEIMRLRDSVIIIGHSDINEMNPGKLSLDRAENVKQHFIEFGVPKNKIRTIAESFDKPKVSASQLKRMDKPNRKKIAEINARVIIKLY